jgi:transcriptional regulator with XRE-family HTH domain
MISRHTRQEIILRSNREGKSQHQISRELGISRKTVSKYLFAYENTKLGLCTKPKLCSYLSTSPKYATPIRSKTVLTDKIKARIDAFNGKTMGRTFRETKEMNPQ